MESNNQYMQQQLMMQSSFLIDYNEPSQMDLTRMVFGPDATEISAIDGKHKIVRAANQTLTGGSHVRRVSNMSANTLDQSAFNCEVHDQDESLIDPNRNQVGDNY